MYMPNRYQVSDPTKLHAFIRDYSFAVLFAMLDGKPVATHAPLLLDETRGERGFLLGHVAKANEQWRCAERAPAEVLAVFHGPHAYISPTWYGEPGFVPTWDYCAVHVYGTMRLITEPAATAAVLDKLVQKFESSMPKPWTIDPPGRFDALMQSIVAFEIEITRIEGQWKLNQNHSRERQARVAAQLQTGDANARAIAGMILQNLEKSAG